jgi:hypothetical protein
LFGILSLEHWVVSYAFLLVMTEDRWGPQSWSRGWC